MEAANVIHATVLRAFYVHVFLTAGVSPEDAHLAADVRIESALRLGSGLDAFAIARLRNTVRRLHTGSINPSPRLTVLRERGPMTLLDGDNGLGAVVGARAMERCLAKAQEHGLAVVGVCHSTTLGMMAYYAMRALAQQAIGFAATNTELKIGLPPWGGLTPALGNNPFAVAIPGGQGPDLVLDMSVIATRPQGDAIPPDPTNTRGPIGSTFLSRPIIGEHKGYGLALVLEVLAGVLTGAGFGQEHAPEHLETPGVPPNLGHLFAVLDPTVFMPRAQFQSRMEQLRAEILQGERLPGVTRLLLPGELEHERRQARLQHGIPVHADAPAALSAFCASLGLESPLMT